MKTPHTRSLIEGQPVLVVIDAQAGEPSGGDRYGEPTGSRS